MESSTNDVVGGLMAFTIIVAPCLTIAYCKYLKYKTAVAKLAQRESFTLPDDPDESDGPDLPPPPPPTPNPTPTKAVGRAAERWEYPDYTPPAPVADQIERHEDWAWPRSHMIDHPKPDLVVVED